MFAHSSKTPLTLRDVDRFPTEGLFDRIARAVCAAGCLPRKELFEAWETAKQAPIPKVPDSEPPHGVDYDLWLGPAPKRPFNRYRFHGNWRWFFDYGSGDLGSKYQDQVGPVPSRYWKNFE